LPAGAARLLGNDAPPPSRTLEIPRATEPAATPAPAALDAARGDTLEGVFPPGEVHGPADGAGAPPVSRPPLPGVPEGDALGQVPIVGRDGKVAMVDRAAIGAEAERHGFMAQLIGNCVL